MLLDSDADKFGGFGNIDDKQAHFTLHDPLYAEEHKGWLQMYLPARTAFVFRKK
jgi:1,4-alpha-glucan branching enzyme